MNLSGVSSASNSFASCERTETQSDQNSSDNSQGWKYLTVKIGDTVYTYLVIGKNMRVLIGTNSVSEDKDKKTTDDKKEDNSSTKLNEAKQNDSGNPETEKMNFLMDHRMLGLTGFYQKKLREMMKDMEDQIACDKVGFVETKKKVEKKQELKQE